MSFLRRPLTLWLAVGALLVVSARAEATPIQFGSNYYELILVLPSGFSDGSTNEWSDAQAAANASTYGTATGHLATITSAAEDAFLASLATSAGLTGFQGAWLGGNYLGWTEGPDAGVLFATSGVYTNFQGIEPNNAGLLYMSIGAGASNGYPIGKWVDDSQTQGLPEYPADPVIGYFVEYESPRFPVPEPGSLALLGLGLLSTPALRRRMRRS